MVYVLVQRLNGEWKYSSMYTETYVVAQLVEILHYKLEGCRFNSCLNHCDFPVT